ncbi:DUF572-domain-containing protein [Coprinellus micaceus]|uniref:DUF572-domain-containing protein n=1 Tax=Coprinellus micaceus TaxID=71717 RepID=A0A4Y7SZG2_COPMI|nr:DUF572-domain-containing protein [Coprinellus micaceus]
MQGFNKYYPPDWDPSKGGLNKYHGKHALGDRARKIDKGILIVRFELPFNIWCGTCNNHIGMGVRYNAEKKKIGSYYSTPIYSFRCKCHLCDGWFEIETDPKNTRYVVTSGARQQEQDWDPEDNGGFAIHGQSLSRAPLPLTSLLIAATFGSEAPLDPLAALEKTTEADRVLNQVAKPRIEALQSVSDHYNADPYAMSSRIRKRFREDKKVEQNKRAADDNVKSKYGLPSTLSLVEDDDEARQEAKSEWDRARSAQASRESAKRRKLSTEINPYPQLFVRLVLYVFFSRYSSTQNRTLIQARIEFEPHRIVAISNPAKHGREAVIGVWVHIIWIGGPSERLTPVATILIDSFPYPFFLYSSARPRTTNSLIHTAEANLRDTPE